MIFDASGHARITQTSLRHIISASIAQSNIEVKIIRLRTSTETLEKTSTQLLNLELIS
jgi:hypothetical protein